MSNVRWFQYLVLLLSHLLPVLLVVLLSVVLLEVVLLVVVLLLVVVIKLRNGNASVKLATTS